MLVSLVFIYNCKDTYVLSEGHTQICRGSEGNQTSDARGMLLLISSPLDDQSKTELLKSVVEFDPVV